MTHPDHIAAPPGELYWRYDVPRHMGAKMLLRTIGGVAVTGNWYGAYGFAFIAWCPLPANAPVDGTPV